MAVNQLVETRKSVIDWIIRGAVSVTCYLVAEMHTDLKKISESVPVIQEQIRVLQSDGEKVHNKIFTRFFLPAKKEEEITFDHIIKSEK